MKFFLAISLAVLSLMAAEAYPNTWDDGGKTGNTEYPGQPGQPGNPGPPKQPGHPGNSGNTGNGLGRLLGNVGGLVENVVGEVLWTGKTGTTGLPIDGRPGRTNPDNTGNKGLLGGLLGGGQTGGSGHPSGGYNNPSEPSTGDDSSLLELDLGVNLL